MANDIISTRETRIKTKEILISQLKRSLDICDIFQAAKTNSDLFRELGIDEERKILTHTEAHDYIVDIRRLFSSAEDRCKCVKQ